jgi:hypothetical protein
VPALKIIRRRIAEPSLCFSARVHGIGGLPVCRGEIEHPSALVLSPLSRSGLCEPAGAVEVNASAAAGCHVVSHPVELMTVVALTMLQSINA